MKRKIIILGFPLFFILLNSLFAQVTEGKSEQENVTKQKLAEKWQKNPQELAKLFYGDPLTLRPPTEETTFISKPEIKEKVIGSNIEWRAFYGINPGWLGIAEKDRKLLSDNTAIYCLLNDDKNELVGYITIGGTHKKGEKEIDYYDMTWGIPPNADLNVKMKIKSISQAIILKNGMLMMIVGGSDLIINSLSKTCDWPPLDEEHGMLNPFYDASNLEVRVSNALGFQVKAGVRSDGKGIDFIVPGTGSASVYIPRGNYEIYFQFAIDPTSLYKGDNFVLDSSGLEIKLGKTTESNYNVKKIK